MKRRLSSAHAEASPCEASPKPPKQHYPWSARNSKKPRPLHAVIGTPSFGTPQEQAPTPDTIRLARPCDPLTAERKFAGISLNSPVMGLTENSLPSKGRRNELSRFSPAFTSAAQQSPSFAVGLAQPGAEDEEDDDDGFCIISSQSYSRMSSQVVEPCTTPTEQIKQVNLLAQDSQETQLTHFSFGGAQQPGSQPSQAVSAQDTQPGPPAGPGLGTMAAAMAANNTPELNDSTTVTSVAEEGGTATNEEECSTTKLFPIFRPMNERKMLIIIRHGESEYNKAAVENRALADPNIYDPKLTAAGHQQALALRAKLQEYINRHGEALWLTSPLTRCIETFLDACPQRDRLVPRSALGPSKKPLNVRVLSSISEHVHSTGDIGRPPSALIKDFPMLASQLKELDECWWFNNEERPNCAVNKVFGMRENKDQLKRRVENFASWLGKRPEKLVIAFGHSTFWKEFSKSPSRMKNGELKALRW